MSTLPPRHAHFRVWLLADQGRRAAEDRLSFGVCATFRPPVRCFRPGLSPSSAHSAPRAVLKGRNLGTPSRGPRRRPPVPHRPPAPIPPAHETGFPVAGGEGDYRGGLERVDRLTRAAGEQGARALKWLGKGRGVFPSPLRGPEAGETRGSLLGKGWGSEASGRTNHPHPETGLRPVSDLPSKGRQRSLGPLDFRRPSRHFCVRERGASWRAYRRGDFRIAERFDNGCRACLTNAFQSVAAR